MTSIDYEHELSNGWGKWENLVLTALKENAANTKVLDDKLDSVITTQAVTTLQVSEVKSTQEVQGKRLNRLEIAQATIKGGWILLTVLVSGAVGVAGLAIGILSWIG